MVSFADVSEVTSTSTMTHKNSHAKRWTRSLLEHLFNSYESYWTHCTGRAPTPYLEQGKAVRRKNKSLPLDTVEKKPGWWLGPGLNPHLFLATVRKCGSHLVSIFRSFQDVSFCASLVGCVAKRILATVLKTTRMYSSDINSPLISAHFYLG